MRGCCNVADRLERLAAPLLVVGNRVHVDLEGVGQVCLRQVRLLACLCDSPPDAGDFFSVHRAPRYVTDDPTGK